MFKEKIPAKPLRLGMIGGGAGSQIGYAHRNAAQRDGHFQLVAGAFDLDFERGKDFAQKLNLDLSRCYPDYQSLFRAEAMREDGIQAVVVATPNNTHYEISKYALESGLHVICEKPLTFTSEQAQELANLSVKNNLVLAVMYGYCGYPMVEQARSMIKSGELGEVRLVKMEFAHGYHAKEVEAEDSGTKWRISPAIAGSSYVLGDIGTHAFQMGQHLAGCEVRDLLCQRQSFIASRAPLEDNAHVLLNYQNGAAGSLWASAVNIGSAHGFKVRIIGSQGMLEWWDECPNQLQVAFHNRPLQIYEKAMPYLSQAAQFHRIGGGHPEGFFDSWANLYARFAAAMSCQDREQEKLWYPSHHEGLEGVLFVEKCVESAEENKWLDFK